MVTRALAALIILLAACRGFAADAALDAALQEAPVCCASFADVEFQSIDFSARQVSLRIGPPLSEKGADDAVYPAMHFEAGKSFFYAIALPDFESPYRFESHSFALGGWMPAAKAFYPVFLFLDEKKQPIREVRSKLTWEDGALLGGYIKDVVTILPQDAYLIVLTDPRLFGFTTRYSQGSRRYAVPNRMGGMNFASTEGTQWNLPFNPSGKIRLLFPRREK